MIQLGQHPPAKRKACPLEGGVLLVLSAHPQCKHGHERHRVALALEVATRAVLLQQPIADVVAAESIHYAKTSLNIHPSKNAGVCYVHIELCESR